MILNIKICNKPPCCHFLVIFMYMEDVRKHQSQVPYDLKRSRHVNILMLFQVTEYTLHFISGMYLDINVAYKINLLLVNDIHILYLHECEMTLIEDDPPKKHVCQGKMFLSKSELTPPKIKHAKRQYFAIDFKYLIHKAYTVLSAFTSQCHCLHLHVRCFHLPLTRS